MVEILFAIIILGAASAALLGAVATVALTSKDHTDQARAENVLTSAADAIRDPQLAHVACATPSTASYLAAARSATVPSGWAANSAITITAVRYWDGDTFGTTCYDTVPLGNLLRLQLVTVRVTSPDGRTIESVSVVKAASA